MGHTAASAIVVSYVTLKDNILVNFNKAVVSKTDINRNGSKIV